MSDFVYSSVRRDEGELSRVIRTSFQREEMDISEFHGTWGSLAVSKNIYAGFDILENDRYVFFVLGGPVLNYQDNIFLSKDNSIDGTQSLFNKFIRKNIVFHEDLSGPFVIFCIDKFEDSVCFVTDMMLFIPVYQCLVDGYIYISSHIDVISVVSGKSSCFDYASLVDFILHGTVTFPCTVYSNIEQSCPGSFYFYKIKNSKVQSFDRSEYWLPYEKNDFSSIQHAALELRKCTQGYVERVTSGMSEVAQFLSGGEDSRVIAGILSERLKRDGFIFLDMMNREGLSSSRVADVYGVNLHIHVRPKMYYFDILPDASRLVGLGHQYSHAHSLGLHIECCLDRYAAVFGGYFSDSLLKGIYRYKIRRLSRMHFVPDFFLNGENRTDDVQHPCFDSGLLRIVTDRRREHYRRVAALRPRTAHEWFTLWPATMRASITNIHASRRLFRSYEPFLGCGVVKVAAGVPIEWKLNRRLFNRAFKPVLYKSRFIMHGNGFFPYYPWWMNMVLRQGVSWGRKISRSLGITKGHQGAWTSWGRLVNSNQWIELYEANSDRLKKIENCFGKGGFAEFDYDKLNVRQKMNIMQTVVSL